MNRIVFVRLMLLSNAILLVYGFKFIFGYRGKMI